MIDRTLMIDCQLLQTSAWDRGMGKYTREFIKALAKHTAPFSEVVFILNKNIPMPKSNKVELKASFKKAKLVYLNLPGNVPPSQARPMARGILNDFIKREYPNRPLDYLITGLFTFDYCSTFPDRCNKYLFFYDLIPLIEWKHFSHLFPASVYFDHFKTIFEADKIFSISQAVSSQLSQYLGIDPNKVVALAGSYTHQSYENELDSPVKGRYILLPTADFPHKNNVNAVKGFAIFNQEFGNTFKLVVTSNLEKHTREELQTYSEDLLFIGNVSDDKYKQYLQNCEFVLFMSKIEGLGLPVLEAVAANKKVVCSSIPALKEISDNAFYLSQPDSFESISRAMVKAITAEEWELKQKEYKVILKKYTWANTVSEFINSLIEPSVVNAVKKQSPKLAVIASARSLQKLNYQAWLPALSQEWDTAFFLSKGNLSLESPLFIEYMSDVYPLEDVNLIRHRINDYPVKLYIIDNNDEDAEVYRWAVLCSGVVLMLDSELVKPARTLAKNVGLKPLSSQQKSDRAADDLWIVADRNKTITVNSSITKELQKHKINTTTISPDDAPFIIGQRISRELRRS